MSFEKVGSKWKVWFDSTLHDPLDLALSLLLVTLLPLVNQGPYNTLAEGADITQPPLR